jgi:hypothetical protein
MKDDLISSIPFKLVLNLISDNFKYISKGLTLSYSLKGFVAQVLFFFSFPMGHFDQPVTLEMKCVTFPK